MQPVRFERHEGSGYPLRAVYPDGSWLAVNRDHRGLYAGDANGRITPLLPPERFHAVSPRQFAQAYRKAFGESLRAHARTATFPRESAAPPLREGAASREESATPPARGFAEVRSSYVPAPPREGSPRDSAPRATLPDAPRQAVLTGPPIHDPFADLPPPPPPAPSRVRALFYPDPTRSGSLGLLLVRVAAGGLLVPHGVSKLLGGVSGFAGALAAKGLPSPLVLAWCATLAEAVGGALVVLGLLTRPAALSAFITMVVAWSTTHLADAAKIGTGKGVTFEYPLLMSLIFMAITFAGPGRYSLDALIFGRRRG